MRRSAGPSRRSCARCSEEVAGRAAHARGAQLRRVQPGKPNQNAYAESFDGRRRDEGSDRNAAGSPRSSCR
ncbi:hypothetical protein XhyaCFBP1156_17760 [Xanthomonas hyacinthi]|uniref:Integrase catalytic domain-containing protein n=1 Tax=Xanthomonas hyacinthi TaxID=56455 RepID=A0A2S7ERK0_9XANT|nr:hypothetical protein XhyaCFBP1156_17760 [Xanthomonas hyacinthi]